MSDETKTPPPLDGTPVIGGFYWVLLVADPDAEEDWENNAQPARYAGDAKWNVLGVDGETDWPVRWVGPRIVEPR